MDQNTAALLCIGSMLFLLMFGIPIVYSLGFSALVFGFLVYGDASFTKLGWLTFNALYSFSWTPLPLFVLMACIIAETNIGGDLYLLARKWFSRIPGGLISGSIIGEAAIAATVGVSGAAILTVGKVADSEFKKYGYNRGFALGGVLCGGVLGPLIPPSAPLIIYGITANASVGHLLVAGIVPGILLACVLATVPIIMSIHNPALGPVAGSATWAERFSLIKNIWPVVVVFMSIMGVIYFGIATPSEAAGIGCVVLMILVFVFYKLRMKGFGKAIVEAAQINAMMLFIVVIANFFTYVVGSSGMSKQLGIWISSLELSPIMVIAVIMLILLVLGCFLEALTIVLLTVPIFVPIITQLGFDPVWFGILFVVNTEIGCITPPMGINLFYVRAIFDIHSSELIRGMLPYLIAIIAFLVILVIFPQISLWLPSTMSAK
jgi:C4-dicarboxylate transporter, DctM subunit